MCRQWQRDQQRQIVLAGALVALAGLIPIVATATDARLDACYPDGSRVVATFELEEPSDFWTHFPDALDAPELRAADGKAFVAVFETLRPVPPAIGADAARPTMLRNAVCVVLADGTPILYHDIPGAGDDFRLTR
jgi:hypothetical protein